MRFLMTIGRGAVLVLALGSTAVNAQEPNTSSPPPAVSTDPADQLAANLMILSQRPRDVSALIGAGLSAIAIGDGNAALGFLGRAEEISPSNGRIKAALGSALLLVERPSDALRLFAEASNLGVPDRDIARDRGLAYDLRGDPKRAQRDYQLAQQRDNDDELTRRYALSLGISGDRDKALTLLAPLLQKQDQAAWRARAFVLAMNGDVTGAEQIASSVMPSGSNATMSPFLRRLASLNAAERALAVNFGTMPSDGQRYASVETGDPFRPVGSGAGNGLIPAGDGFGAKPAEVAVVTPAPILVSKEPRRRPGRGRDRDRVTLTANGAIPQTQIAANEVPAVSTDRIGRRLGPVAVAPAPQQVAGLTNLTKLPSPATANPAAPVFEVPAAKPPAPVVATPVPTPAPTQFASIFVSPSAVIPDAASIPARVTPPPAAVVITTPPVIVAPTPVVVTPAPEPMIFGPPAPVATPGFDLATTIPPAPVNTPVAAKIVETPVVPVVSGLSAIIATIEPEAESVAAPLPTASELRAARIALQRKADAAAKLEAAAKAEKDKREAERAEAAKHPPRIWVQVAGGANRAGLPATWKKMRDGNAALFKGVTAWSTPLNRTNRLLVGPFKSNGEARDLVNKLGKAGISGFTFSSAQGQEIDRLGGR
jgi:Flp pilus assembly protein TadD